MGVYQREVGVRLSEADKRTRLWINRNKKGAFSPRISLDLQLPARNSHYPAIFNVRPCLQTIASLSEPRILFACPRA